MLHLAYGGLEGFASGSEGATTPDCGLRLLNALGNSFSYLQEWEGQKKKRKKRKTYSDLCVHSP